MAQQESAHEAPVDKIELQPIPQCLHQYYTPARSVCPLTIVKLHPLQPSIPATTRVYASEPAGSLSVPCRFVAYVESRRENLDRLRKLRCHRRTIPAPAWRVTYRETVAQSAMVTEQSIWRCANVFIDEYGKNAVFHARQRADALLRESNDEGHKIWQRVVAAIEELQRAKPYEGEPVN